MAKKFTLLFILMLGLFMAAGCSNTDSTEDVIGKMAGTSLDTVSEAISDINNSGTTETTPISFIFNPKMFEETSSLKDRIVAFVDNYTDKYLDAISADALSDSKNCPGGGTVTRTGFSWGSSSAFTVDRKFTACKGRYGRFQADGDVYLGWSGLNTNATPSLAAPYVQTSSQLLRAPSKKITHVSTGNYVQMTGTLSDTVTYGTNPAINAAHKLLWTAVSGTTRTFSLTKGVSRKGYKADGTLVFDHTVTTPGGPMTVTVNTSAGTRTVSGTMQVYHALADITMTATYTNVVHDIDYCLPASGSISIALSGKKSGNGTITFNNGEGFYDYTAANGGTFSGSFDLAGCSKDN